MNPRFPSFGFRRSVLTGAIALIAVCTLAGSCGFAAGPPPDIGFDQKLGDKIPLGLKFRDENGADVELGSYFGKKPVILMPVYYKCPMLCGLELNGMVRCLRAMNLTLGMTAEKDFEIVTFSIDPKEKPELASRKRKQYLAQYGCESANDGWHFLTGDQEEIKKLCDTIGFRAKLDEVTGQYAHAAGVVVCTPEGVISRYLYGVEFAPKDLRLAVVESAVGRVGTLAEHVLLFCFRYDPTEGKYGLAIMNLLRASGVLTIVLLAGCVGVMMKRDRESTKGSVPFGGAHHG